MTFMNESEIEHAFERFTTSRAHPAEVKHAGQWIDAPGEGSAGIPTVDGSPSDWDDVRMVREDTE